MPITPPFIILCAARSFSSVVSAMLGQHPQIFATPELNLFITDTISQLLGRVERKQRSFTLHGLIRTLAQIRDGEQTDETVATAREWIESHADWTTERMFRYLAEQVAPRILSDKSPTSATKAVNLDRLFRACPEVRVLHLMRHPAEAGNSLHRIWSARAAEQGRDFSLMGPQHIEDHWVKTQQNIVDFTKRLGPGQYMRLRGELLMADADRYLGQICRWLGLDDSAAVIEAMKHPEDGPFSRVGPKGARTGANREFLKNPEFRPGQPREPGLDQPVSWLPDKGRFAPRTIELAQRMGYR